MTQLKRLELFLPIAVLIIALVLRIWGVEFGLPYIYHIDEPRYVEAALNLGAGIVDRQPYPTGFSNILFGEYGAYFVLGRSTGMFNSTAGFEQSYRTDPSVFLLFGRLTSIALGTITVLLIYWLGREVRGWLVGVLAAWFMAVAFLHIRDSHYAVPDAAMTFFVTLSVLFCVLALQHSNWRYQGLAAVAGGFAIATKWTALPVVVPLTLAAFYGGSGLENNNVRSRIFNRWIFASLILCAVGFFIGGFQVFLQPTAFINNALHEAGAGEAGGFGFWQIDTVPGWVFYLKTLNYGIGSVLLALGILGGLRHLFLAFRTRDKISILLLAFPLTYYLFMGTTRHYFARYTLPLIPFMVLFAAEVTVVAATWAETKRARLGWGLATTLVIVVTVPALLQSIQHNLLLTRQDTRTLARQWIETHIPEGSKIAVDWETHGPPLSTPEQGVPYSDKVYDLSIVRGTGLSKHSVDWYLEQGFDYLIASSFVYNIPLVYEKQNMERQLFYASLDQDLELIKEFRPYKGEVATSFIFNEIYGPAVNLWQRERPGPIIKVYKLDLQVSR